MHNLAEASPAQAVGRSVSGVRRIHATVCCILSSLGSKIWFSCTNEPRKKKPWYFPHYPHYNRDTKAHINTATVVVTVEFSLSLLSFSPSSRFSNLQTRSCSTAAAGAWAPAAQSPPQGKLRNDSSSFALDPRPPRPPPPSLLPSLPLFSFLSPNSQKSNLYPGLFFFPFLSVLLKKHLMLQIVWVSAWVRAQMTERASSAGEHYNHVCTCKFCARVLEIFLPLSLTAPPRNG